MLREGGMTGRGKKCLQFVHQFDLLSEKELVSVPRNLLLLLLSPKENTKFFNPTQASWFEVVMVLESVFRSAHKRGEFRSAFPHLTLKEFMKTS